MAFQIYNSPFLCCPSDSSPFSSVSSPSLHLPTSNHLTSLPNLSIKPKILNLDCRRRQIMSVNCHTTAERLPTSGDRMLVFVPPHPLIKHWVSVLRNELTPCPVFKNAMAELGRLLIYEASRDWLPTISGEIQTPLGAAAVEFVDPREPIAVSLSLSLSDTHTHTYCSHIESWPCISRACSINFASNKNIPSRD